MELLIVPWLMPALSVIWSRRREVPTFFHNSSFMEFHRSSGRYHWPKWVKVTFFILLSFEVCTRSRVPQNISDATAFLQTPRREKSGDVNDKVVQINKCLLPPTAFVIVEAAIKCCSRIVSWTRVMHGQDRVCVISEINGPQIRARANVVFADDELQDAKPLSVSCGEEPAAGVDERLLDRRTEDDAYAQVEAVGT